MIPMKSNRSFLQLVLGVVLLLAAPVGIIFRIMQLLYAIDYTTGFYKEWHFSVSALDITLIVAAAAVILTAFFLRKMELSVPAFKPFGLTLLSFFCAAGILAQLVLQFLQAESWSALFLVSTALSAASFLCFLVLGFRHEQNKASSSAFLIRNIVLTLWCCSEILLVFFDHSTKSNTSEFVFSIVFLYFASIFFVKYGKLAFYSGPTHRASFSLLLSASLMMLFGFILSIPDFFLLFSGEGTWKDLSPFACMALPLAAYGTLFICFNCFRSGSKNSLRI